MELIELSYEECLVINKGGLSEPPGILSPFIRIDRSKYHNIYSKSKTINIKDPRNRLGEKSFAKIRGALASTLRFSQTFFPAYRFLLNEFVNDEWLSSVDWHKFHRDHMLHQHMTTTLGMWIIKGGGDKFKPNGRSILEHAVDSIIRHHSCRYIKKYLREMNAPEIYFESSETARGLWEDVILDTFFLAALFHDIGYPWLFFNRLSTELSQNIPSGIPLKENADWVINNYKNRLFMFPFNGYERSLSNPSVDWNNTFLSLIEDALTKTHGFPGALSFIHLNDILKKFPATDASPIRQFCIDWAAMAIMMHDMSGIYAEVDDDENLKIKIPQLRLTFRKDPLSSILTLCDLIQDFNRPDAIFLESEDNGLTDVKISYQTRCQGTRIDWIDESILKVTYLYNNRAELINQHVNFIPKNQLLYFDDFFGYLDFSEIGINKIILSCEYKP